MHTREDKRPERKPWRLLLWAAVVGLLVGLFAVPNPLEDGLRTARNKFHRHNASGDIVLVKIDNESLQQVGRWPWPRREFARLVDQLTKAGAKRIFFDLAFYEPSDAVDDQQFAESIGRSGRVVLAVKGSVVREGQVADEPPINMLAAHAQLGAIGWHYNYQNAVWELPYAVTSGQGAVPGYAALLAHRSGETNSLFRVDYSVDPDSIPTVSADKILRAQFDRSAVAGKDVVIGATTNAAADMYLVPGYSQAGGVYIHVIGAETLKRGIPVDLGWLPDFFLSLLAATAALLRKRIAEQAAILGATAVVLLLGTAFLEAHLIFFDITPGLLAVGWVGAALRSARACTLRHPGRIDHR